MKEKKVSKLQKCHFEMLGKCAGSSHDFPQTFKVLMNLILLEKDLDICFIML